MYTGKSTGKYSISQKQLTLTQIIVTTFILTSWNRDE